MKKIISILLIFVVFVSSPIKYNRDYCFAEQTQVEIETELNNNIDDQIDNLDFFELDQILNELNEENFFKGDSFSQKVKKIINGELNLETSSLLSYVLNLLLDDIIKILPYICLIIAISVLFSMVNSTKSSSKGITDVIHFVCYGAIVVTIVALVSGSINMVTSSLKLIKRQMDAIFPILLTIMTALGGSTSVGVYQPAMAMLSGTVVNLFITILLPIFTFKLIFTIISNLTTNIKFDKFADFFGSLFKWFLGIILTVFTTVVSVQGLMAGSIDTIGIKATKFTIKSTVPVIGSFVSDGLSLIMASSMLIKNAVGVGGLILLFSSIILPIINIIVFSHLLKLACAILEPISDSRVTRFIGSVGKSIQLLIAVLVGVAFMYFIMIGLVMCSTNIL